MCDRWSEVDASGSLRRTVLINKNMSSNEAGRPKRKASATLRARQSRGKQAPSSAHYVGYVQDDETPEMIMKKFEEMERIRQATRAAVNEGNKENDESATNKDGGGGGGGDFEEDALDEEQLKELFKNTSTFTVKEAVMDSNALFGDLVAMGRLEEGMYFSDEDEMEDEFWEALTGKKRRYGKRSKGPRVPRPPREPREPKAQQSHMITAYNSDQGLFLRKKKFVDPAEPYIIKIPPHPIPVSWGRVIQPYEPKSVRAAKLEAVADCQHMQAKIKDMAFDQLGTDYLGVLLNPPWNIEDSPDRGDVTVEDIAAIPLEQLTPLGFIFIWVEKENLSHVCDIMDQKNFVYVENLTWVHLKPNNTIVESAARYLGRSHRTLLIFRRDVRDKRFIEGKKIELRHQRNSDVTLDIVQTTSTGRRAIPEHVYKSIETLLPTAYEPGTPGKLLELWAEPGARRAGWTSVADTP